MLGDSPISDTRLKLLARMGMSGGYLEQRAGNHSYGYFFYGASRLASTRGNVDRVRSLNREAVIDSCRAFGPTTGSPEACSFHP